MSFFFLAASYVYDIAVDPTIRRVVYTDHGLKHIAALNYDGSNHEVVLQSSDLGRPGAIVLEPETRYVHVQYVGTTIDTLSTGIAKCLVKQARLYCIVKQARLHCYPLTFLVKVAIL